MSSTECPARVSSKSVLSRVSRKSVKKECQARVSCQDCSVKSVQQKCQARVCSKSVQQECQERVSCKSVLPRVCSKRVLSRVPCKTLLLLDDCASHLHKEKTSIFISALVSVHSALHKVTAFGFVGSIRFFTRGFWTRNFGSLHLGRISFSEDSRSFPFESELAALDPCDDSGAFLDRWRFVGASWTAAGGGEFFGITVEAKQTSTKTETENQA